MMWFSHSKAFLLFVIRLYSSITLGRAFFTYNQFLDCHSGTKFTVFCQQSVYFRLFLISLLSFGGFLLVLSLKVAYKPKV